MRRFAKLGTAKTTPLIWYKAFNLDNCMYEIGDDEIPFLQFTAINVIGTESLVIIRDDIKTIKEIDNLQQLTKDEKIKIIIGLLNIANNEEKIEISHQLKYLNYLLRKKKLTIADKQELNYFYKKYKRISGPVLS